ncbi:MAG: hypothetical protein ACI9FB_002833 [Candidatus Azotimanducaceae bacterium]|jgi:hypothetical protein
MNGINHAATALLVKRAYPDAPLLLLLFGTILSDLLWALLVLLGIEHITYIRKVSSFSGINLEFMPYSHAITSVILVSAVAALVSYSYTKKSKVAAAFAIAIFSHVVLDLAVHAHDIPVTWFSDSIKLGVGLYNVPVWAFIVEIAYMLICWFLFGRNYVLLFWMLVLNLSALTLYFPGILGPEAWFNEGDMYWLFPVLAVLNSIVSIFVVHISVERYSRPLGKIKA